MKPSRIRRIDPGGIIPLERVWTIELNRRFRELKKILLQGLKDQGISFTEKDAIHTIHFNVYDFATNPQKVKSFSKWVDSQIDAKILMPVQGNQHWSKRFVDSAFKKGMNRAITQLNKKGKKRIVPADGILNREQAINIAFNTPTHLDRAEAVFIRNYEALTGITKYMSAKIANALADGVLKGSSPYGMAAEIRKSVDITAARARVIARTEVARAHNIGLVNSYREAEVEGVHVIAEFITAGDDNVCTECQRLERISQKKPFTLDEAEGMIPVHPNCRCTLAPSVGSITLE